MSDSELLQQYIDGSQAAFTALVRRHIDLVHSAAMRQLRDPHLAEDVVQRVFLALSQKAAGLLHHKVLAAWLYSATRYACLDAIKQRTRREIHEQKAAHMAERSSNHSTSTPDRHAIWAAMEPALDSAMSDLNRRDRQLLIMRFWECRSIEEVAGILGVSSDAAKKRLSRAIERLRSALLSHGVAVPLASLTPLLLQGAVHPAPAGLASQTAAAVFSGPGVAAGSGLALKGAITIMAWTKTKLAVVILVALFTLGGSAYVVQRMNSPRTMVVSLPQQGASGSIVPPPAAIDGTWRAQFNKVYGLAPGQVLKRVVPPFVPERKLMWQTDAKDLARMMPDIDGMWMAFDDDGTVHWRSAAVGQPSVGTALESGVGLRPYEVEAAIDPWKVRLPGDIVTRHGATREQKLADLEPILGAVFDRSVSFEKKHVIRNVLIITGEYKPIPASKGNGQGPYEPVEVGPGKRGGGNNTTSTSFEGFCGALELMLRMRVIDRRSAKPLKMVTFRNNNVTPAITEDPAKLQALLSDLSRQTSLQFAVEPQALDVWELKGIGAETQPAGKG